MIFKGWNEDVKARRAHLDEMNAIVEKLYSEYVK